MTLASHPPRLSIRTWLLLLVLAFVLPLGALFAQYLVVAQEAARAAAYSDVQELVRATAARLELALRDHEGRLKVVANEFRGAPPIRAERFQSAQFVELNPPVIQLAVHDLQANSLHSYPGDPEAAEITARSPWYQDALRAEAFRAGEAFYSQLSGRWVSVWSHPVYGANGARTGIVSTAIDLLQLNARVLSASAVPAGFAVAVLDQDGKFLLRSIEPEKWIGQAGPDLGSSATKTNKGKELATVSSVEGTKKMVAMVHVPGTRWRVVAGVDEAQAMAGYHARRNQGLVGGLAIVLLVLALAWRIASTIAEPVRTLADAAARGAQGDSLVRVVPSGPAEIEFVGRQFNSMLDVRLVAEQALRESESRWKFALEGAGDGIWDWNMATGEAFFSPQYKTMLGYGEDEMGCTVEDWAALVHPEDLAGAWSEVLRHREGRSAAYATEYRMLRKDGSWIWVLARGLVIAHDASQQPQRMVGTIGDITHRKTMESDLRIAAIAFESQQAMFILDEVRKIVRVNQAYLQLLKLGEAEVLGTSPEIIAPTDQAGEAAADSVWDKIARGGEFSGEMAVRCKTGERIPVWATLKIVRDKAAKVTHYVGTYTDISDRKRLELKKEKEELTHRNALVREVHHRVKNSLQGVVGILREFGRNHPETMEPISQAVGQVQSIAVIHGLQGQSVTDQVRLCELTTAIAGGIESLWRRSIRVAIPDPWVPCVLAAPEAVPVALVLNELVLNAVKHGDATQGRVEVTLQKGVCPDMVCICIANPGVWQSASQGDHVGLQLVDSLMPRHGAKLSRAHHAGCIVTTLELGPPVISLETAKAT